MECAAHPLPKRHASPARPSIAFAGPLGGCLWNRIRGAGHGRTRRARRRCFGGRFSRRHPKGSGSPAGSSAAAASRGRSEAGFLAALREVRLHVLRLDDIEGDLYSEALLVAGDQGGALYEFTLRSETRLLLSGRATVVFDANRRGRLTTAEIAVSAAENQRKQT